MRYVVFLMAILCAVPATAAFYELSYTEKVVSWNNQLLDAVESEGLDAKHSHAAVQTAAAWFFLGPCRGESSEIGDDRAHGSMQIVGGVDVSVPFYRAVILAIGVLSTQAFNGTPDPDLCRFARDVGGAY